jgi:hypothetical protein
MAGEGRAGDIIRPRTWAWNGPHHICTSHTPHDSSRLCVVFANVDKKEFYNNNMRANPVPFFLQVIN